MMDVMLGIKGIWHMMHKTSSADNWQTVSGWRIEDLMVTGRQIHAMYLLSFHSPLGSLVGDVHAEYVFYLERKKEAN